MEVPQGSRMGSQEHEVCPSQGTLCLFLGGSSLGGHWSWRDV